MSNVKARGRKSFCSVTAKSPTIGLRASGWQQTLQHLEATLGA